MAYKHIEEYAERIRELEIEKEALASRVAELESEKAEDGARLVADYDALLEAQQERDEARDHAAALYAALLKAATLADAHNGDETPSDIPESGKTWTSKAGRLIRENAAVLKTMAERVRPALVDRLTKERDAALAREAEARGLLERVMDAICADPEHDVALAAEIERFRRREVPRG